MGLLKVVLFQIIFLTTALLVLAGDNAGAPGPDQIDPQHGEDRLFFWRFPILTSCNYTRQAGATCASCSQSLNCRPNNIGFIRNCRGLFRFCNNGYCSLTQSASCANSTTAG